MGRINIILLKHAKLNRNINLKTKNLMEKEIKIWE